MQGNTAYIRPKVVGPFPGPCANGSYMHRAALLNLLYLILLLLVQIYSWRKWETLAGPIAAEEMKGRSNAASTEVVKLTFLLVQI
jgi:hypothetical protein